MPRGSVVDNCGKLGLWYLITLSETHTTNIYTCTPTHKHITHYLCRTKFSLKSHINLCFLPGPSLPSLAKTKCLICKTGNTVLCYKKALKK